MLQSQGGGAENARTENVRLENAAPCDRGGKREAGKRGRGGKCRTGKRGNDEVCKAEPNVSIGTCEASRFDSNSNPTPDSIRFESDGQIRKSRIAAPATFAVVP